MDWQKYKLHVHPIGSTRRKLEILPPSGSASPGRAASRARRLTAGRTKRRLSPGGSRIL